jgi:hypothetical protein
MAPTATYLIAARQPIHFTLAPLQKAVTMAIIPPKYPKNIADPEGRTLDCQAQIEPILRLIVDEANLAGWCPTESINAIEELLRNLRKTYRKLPVSD